MQSSDKPAQPSVTALRSDLTMAGEVGSLAGRARSRRACSPAIQRRVSSLRRSHVSTLVSNSVVYMDSWRSPRRGVGGPDGAIALQMWAIAPYTKPMGAHEACRRGIHLFHLSLSDGLGAPDSVEVIEHTQPSIPFDRAHPLIELCQVATTRAAFLRYIAKVRVCVDLNASRLTCQHPIYKLVRKDSLAPSRGREATRDGRGLWLGWGCAPLATATQSVVIGVIQCEEEADMMRHDSPCLLFAAASRTRAVRLVQSAVSFHNVFKFWAALFVCSSSFQ